MTYEDDRQIPLDARRAVFTGRYIRNKACQSFAELRFEDTNRIVIWPLPLPPGPDTEMRGDVFAISADGRDIYSLA